MSRNQVPEWSSNYIEYKGLKKQIKLVVLQRNNTGETDLIRMFVVSAFGTHGGSFILISNQTAFFFNLDRNLETVDSFFNKRLAEFQRRLKLLQGRYGDHFDWISSENGSVKSDDSGESALDRFGMDEDEMAELLGALLELRSGLRKLQWYGG